MKEDRKREKRNTHKSKLYAKSPSSSSSKSSDSDEWVEKDKKQNIDREDWMSMTGVLKTYTKDDIRPKREDNNKKNIDSYNPATSSRELNPYWKDGGTGIPQTSQSFRKSKPFVRPNIDEDDYYSKSGISRSSTFSYHSHTKSKTFVKPTESNDNYYSKHRSSSSVTYSSTSSYDKYKEYSDKRNYRDANRTSSNWRKQRENSHSRSDQDKEEKEDYSAPESKDKLDRDEIVLPLECSKESPYLSNEKMNKLAAKIVKAEIMGDLKLVSSLKAKLEAAREYRKQHPEACTAEDDKVILTSTSSSGNCRPLTSGEKGDPRSKSGKRKAETHAFGERTKYFGNDDKYDLKQMFQEEKYGNNYNNEAELAKIASKHKNPSDDLEDIFMDEISKTTNAAKDSENEKHRAINEHVKLEKSLDGCEYCVDSKNMLKHLMVSIGNKVYLSVPARKSLVDDHCIITTIQHSTCVTAIDEDIWEEILNYRKALTKFYNSQNKDVVFFETAIGIHKYPHMVINCVPLPRDVGDMAAIYFKKALLECESEWSMNKKVVDLKGKNIRKGIPKGLPYFWIDFGMDPGFAHVIEDQQLFPKNFAEEIIAGILDLDHSLWKNPRKDYRDIQRKKALDFIKQWKSFEPTETKKI